MGEGAAGNSNFWTCGTRPGNNYIAIGKLDCPSSHYCSAGLPVLFRTRSIN